MSALAPLYRDMRANKKSRELYHVQYAKVQIDVFFLIDRVPFELLVGVHGYNLGFVVKIHNGFRAESVPDDVFWKLCNLLCLKPKGGVFTSEIFLKYIASHAPSRCSLKTIQPHQMAPYYSVDSIDDGEKVYFCGWKPHLSDNRHVREKNLEKTEFFFGKQVVDFCRSNNISSAWTDKQDSAMNFVLPPGF